MWNILILKSNLFFILNLNVNRRPVFSCVESGSPTEPCEGGGGAGALLPLGGEGGSRGARPEESTFQAEGAALQTEASAVWAHLDKAGTWRVQVKVMQGR